MENSLLNRLPAEMRNEIYRLVVTSSTALKVCSSSVTNHDDDDDDGRSGPTATQPALTKVCKKIRAESLGLFYLSNKFNIHITGSPRGNSKLQEDFERQTIEVTRWLRQTTARNHLLISRLKLVMYMPWESGRAVEEWAWFLRKFRRYGYRKSKLKTTVHVLSRMHSLRDVLSLAGKLDAFGAEQAQKAKAFFKDMGIKARTNFTFIG